jgi:subtilase family protein
MKKWFFQESPADAQAGQGDNQEPPADARAGRDDSNAPPGLVSLPEALLERHGARVLDPGRAAMVSGYPTPRPTMYRAKILLAPDHVLQDVDIRRDVDGALGTLGMMLKPPDPDLDLADREGEIFQELRQLPRPAVLAPLDDHPTPVVVDAWVALQALRAAAASPQYRALNDSNVLHFELEYLTISSGIMGSPITNGGGGINGSTGSGADVSGPSTTDSYLFSGGDARTPVAVLLDKPAYKTDDDCKSLYGKRPVVAVLDTGVGPHPWLDVAPEGAGGIDPDGPVADDPDIQAAIYAEGEHAVARGDLPRQLIKDVWDRPMTANRLIGELDAASGHGTFIAGIVRQVAPDARILALRVMHPDDVAYTGDILCALRHLAKRIALRAPDDVAAMVDVVSLSFGYFSESPASEAAHSGLWRVIKILLRLGVVVVAGAGNYATWRRLYPAAFATEAVPPDEVPVISVGALNPNGTKAVFSDDGEWVTAFAQGALVLSTYPTDINASRSPELRTPADPPPPGVSGPERAALKADDFSDGWALWSGTSFSTPYMAALVIKSLQEGATEYGLRLGLPGRNARAVAAVDRLRQQDSQGG